MLSIVIVNWNASDTIRHCIESIEKASINILWPIEIIVVDNASTDGSPEVLKTRFPNLILIESITNLGFAGGCNIGAARATNEFLLFLNPDTEVNSVALLTAVDFIRTKSSERVGIVGVRLVGNSGKTARTNARFPKARMFFYQNLGLAHILPRLGHTMKEHLHDVDMVVDQVIGAFFLTTSQLFESLRGFDERFFVYFEEVDFSYRAMKLGYHTVYLSRVYINHEGEGTTSQIKAKRLFYSLRSRLLYGRKHYGQLESAFNFANTLFLEPLSRAAFLLLSGRRQDMPDLLEGFGMLYLDLPNILLCKMKP